MVKSLMYLCIFLAFTSLANAQNETDPEEDVCFPPLNYEDLSNILEEFRLRMHQDMTESLGVPILDPLSIEGVDLDLGNIGELESDVSLSITDLQIRGLNTLHLNRADFSILSKRLILDVSIAFLNLTGDWVGTGSLAGAFNMTGEGVFSLNLLGIDLRLEAEARFINSTWEKASENSTQLDLGLAALEVNFQGLLENEDFFNQILSAIGHLLLAELWPEIRPGVMDILDTALLGFLNGFDANAILEFLSVDWLDLFPPIEPLPPLN